MADAVHGGLVRAGWTPRRATMIAGAVKYLVVGASSTPFASGFADDVQVYLGRYPNLRQAHRLRAHAARIDRESFEVGLAALVRGLKAEATSAAARLMTGRKALTGPGCVTDAGVDSGR